jgi:hypothetical protein
MNLKVKSLSIIALTIGICFATYEFGGTPLATATAQNRPKSGKALYEEKCKTVAGEKIYKKVENVEGIVLLKVRPNAGDREWSDPMWPGAAFALEARTDEYIITFLGYEHSSSAVGKSFTPQYRGYISPNYEPDNPNNNPGYRYVDVIDEKDGKRYRYTGSVKVVGHKDTSAPGVQAALKKDPNFNLDVHRWTLDKIPAPNSSPRYGVTFEDHVIPEERALGLASSTVKVLDLKTNEVLGEMTRYAWSADGPSRANPVPWLTARKCPGHPVGAEAATRKFVDQILVPKRDR